jgi:hypothetical protein
MGSGSGSSILFGDSGARIINLTLLLFEKEKSFQNEKQTRRIVKPIRIFQLESHVLIIRVVSFNQCEWRLEAEEKQKNNMKRRNGNFYA